MNKNKIFAILMAVMVCALTITSMSTVAFAAENQRVVIDPEVSNIYFNDAQWKYHDLYFSNGLPVTLQYFIDNPDASITINGYRNIQMHIGEDNLSVTYFGNNPSVYRLTNSNVINYLSSNPDADTNAVLSVANSTSDGGNISFELSGVTLPEKPNPLTNAINKMFTFTFDGGETMLNFIEEQPLVLVGVAVAFIFGLIALVLWFTKGM